VLGVSWGEFIRRRRASFDASVRELLEMHARGLVRPRIAQRFPLERAADALSQIARRQAHGKFVVTFD
jgi:NADPH2:quinone reductase